MDSVRLGVGKACRGVDLRPGQRQDVDPRKSYAVVTGPDATALRHNPRVDVLPEHTWSLSGSSAPEYTCSQCGKRKLGCFGPVCVHCGGQCFPAAE